MRVGVFWRQVSLGLLRHPVRSLLIFSTFVLGFGAVLGTVATTEGGRRAIRSSLENLGMDVIVSVNRDEPTRHIPFLGKLLTRNKRHIDASLVAELESDLGADVRHVIPLNLEPATVKGVTTLLVATTAEFVDALQSGFLAGEGFPVAEGPRGGPRPAAIPAILDEALAREFSPEDPAALVGSLVPVRREGKQLEARIVGVLKDPILLRNFIDFFDQASARRVSARRLVFKNIYVPHGPQDDVSGVLVQAHAIADVDVLEHRISRFFDERKIDQEMIVQRHWIEHVLAIVERFRYLTHFLWILDLVVMVILTSTITLMAVEERYAEVALKRVEGARIRDVVAPLVAEGVTLALLALPVGLLVGRLIIATWVTPILMWEPYLPWSWFLWIAPLFLVMGGLTNLLPAWRVARLSPARVLGDSNL